MFLQDRQFILLFCHVKGMLKSDQVEIILSGISHLPQRQKRTVLESVCQLLEGGGECHSHSPSETEMRCLVNSLVLKMPSQPSFPFWATVGLSRLQPPTQVGSRTGKIARDGDRPGLALAIFGICYQLQKRRPLTCVTKREIYVLLADRRRQPEGYPTQK